MWHPRSAPQPLSAAKMAAQQQQPPLAMTPAQRKSWHEEGFFVCPDFLSPAELQRLLAAVDDVAAEHERDAGAGDETGFQVRNLLAHGEPFLDLVDHPRMLPLVVDAIGTDIQIRTTHLDYRPRLVDEVPADRVGLGDAKEGQRNTGWHPDLAPQFSGPLDGGPAEGHIPLMEMKVFYALSDMRESNSGNLWLAPGSHRRPRSDLNELQAAGRQPPGALELRLAPGSAVVWRTAVSSPPLGGRLPYPHLSHWRCCRHCLCCCGCWPAVDRADCRRRAAAGGAWWQVWHCVGPQLSAATRKIIHIGYHHRWLRPTDYITQASQPKPRHPRQPEDSIRNRTVFSSGGRERDREEKTVRFDLLA